MRVNLHVVSRIAAALILSLLLITSIGTGLIFGSTTLIQADKEQLIDQLDLQVIFSPPSISPGNTVRLDLNVMGSHDGTAIPEISFSVPEFLEINLDSLPSGAGYGIQSRVFSWQPVLDGVGAASHLSVEFSVLVADLRHPEHELEFVILAGGGEKRHVSTLWVGVAPEADIIIDPPQVAVGQIVRLVARTDSPGPATTLWSLGDGRVLDAVNPEVIYAIPGTYDVALQISNPVGSSTFTSSLIVVPEPIAKFTVVDPTPSTNQLLSFINNSGGDAPLSFLWDFGDGITSSDPNPTHSFEQPGVYPVRLLAENNLGISEIVSYITVGSPPIADMVLNEIVDAGQLISGQAFREDGSLNIRWDMGDGQSYVGGQVDHVYWAGGDYLVTLTVSNEFGDTQISQWVHVRPGQLYLYLPIVFKAESEPLELQEGAEENVLAPQPVETMQTIKLEPLELPETMTPAERLFAYINEARLVNGLPSLNYVHELSVAAQTHTDDMAIMNYTAHTGSDGSSPPLRIQRSGYPGGYAGEATAWGMEFAIDPVEFWLTSPAHRAILLSSLATDVGVGYSVNYGAPSVWYWTAEFASLNLPVVSVSEIPLVQDTPVLEPPIQLLGPPQNSEFVLAQDSNLIFSWTWSKQLEGDQRFSVYLLAGFREVQIGVLDEAQRSDQYQLKIPIANLPVSPGEYEWQVRLRDSSQETDSSDSPYWPIIFVNPTAPSP